MNRRPKVFYREAIFSEEHMLENEDGYDPREMKGAITANRNSMMHIWTKL